jgi:site-specific DNA recombinase
MKQNTRKNLSTGIYVRVSTEEQVQEGFSIRAQTEKLKSYALLKNWDIFDIYSDEGISGKNIVDRPAINRLIGDIESGKVNNVLVFKVDRLTRSTRNLLELVELFEDCNCAFNSLTESIDTDTPSGRMFLKIIGIFAEFERENLASRLTLGFERKVKEGYTLANCHVSYGYCKEKGQRLQKVHIEEAKIVKEIFSMFVDKNISMTGIAKNLNDRKVPTKTKNSSWKPAIIKQILCNTTYIGKVRYSLADKSRYFEADGQHEGIISDEMFRLAQEKIKNMPNVSRTKKPKESNYFCGLLVCGVCGGKFTTKNSGKKNGEEQGRTRAYICGKKTYFNDNTSCRSPQINHEKMERAFIEYIQNINDITESASIDLESNVKNTELEILQSIVDCEKKLSNLQDKKRKIMELFVKGELEFDEYKNMLRMLNEELDTAETELQSKKAELPTIMEIPEVLPEDIVTNIRENWEHLSNQEKMIFLQRFVKNITITVEKENFSSNRVRIDRIEFNTGTPIEKGKTDLRRSLR